MKTADVVSVRHLDVPATHHSNAGANVGRMISLLQHYPNISDEERIDLLGFLTKGNPDEVVRVTLLEGLEPRVAAFRRDHPRDFPSGLRAWLPFLFLLLLAATGVAWRLLV
jgi:hypothetical protein